MDQLDDSADRSAVDSNYDSAPSAAVAFIPGANVDAMNGGSARAPGFDDRIPLLEFFTRKEVMKMVFDTSTRLYQSVAFPDRKPLPKEKELALFRQVFDHTVVAACICLSDDVMKAAFERITADLGHEEDPWAISITREFNRIMQQQAGEG